MSIDFEAVKKELNEEVGCAPTDQDALHEQGVRISVLMALLISKGVFTIDEYKDMLAIVSSQVDQILAEKRKQAETIMKDRFPEMYQAYQAYLKQQEGNKETP